MKVYLNLNCCVSIKEIKYKQHKLINAIFNKANLFIYNNLSTSSVFTSH